MPTGFPEHPPSEEATAEAQLSNAPFFTGAGWKKGKLEMLPSGRSPTPYLNPRENVKMFVWGK